MTHLPQNIISTSFVVDESILLHPLYVKWSAQTFNQILTNRDELKSDLGGIYPLDVTAPIVAYMCGLLYIVGGASSGLIATMF